MSNTWTVEEIFIQLIIENSPLTLVELDHAIKYFSNKHDTIFNQDYNKWIKVRDEYIAKLSINSSIEFSVNHWDYTRKIDPTELSNLKEKILHDEFSLLTRTYKIAHNEAIHADDELWDDR